MSGWGCIITAINPHCCVIFSKTYISPHVCAPSQGQFFFFFFLAIHYYFAQTVISTGNLHLAAICICQENKKETPVCAGEEGFFLTLSLLTATKQPGIPEQQSENLSLWTKRNLDLGKVSWLQGIRD